MRRTSEWVSLGHPDKVADYISCYLLDRYLEQDPNVRYAVEVQIKNEFVSLAGEVTSKVHFTHPQITKFVKAAVEEIGYTTVYQRCWGKDNTIRAVDLKVTIHIGQQSPDIAQGVNTDGWGDQGIFWGMAERETYNKMPMDYNLAKSLGKFLFDNANRLNLGLDIKTQITMNDNKVEKVIVAAPVNGRLTRKEVILREIKDHLGYIAADAEIILNGTGAYRIHGPRGDAGTTGRKLAVDFYGGNCRLGGGSPWTKDASKADLTLNLYARKLALKKLKSAYADAVYCAIECCIGQRDIGITFYNQNMVQISSRKEKRPPSDIITEFGGRMPNYAERCREGLFYDISE